MGDVVNLRTERKRAKRRQAEQEAAANRLLHGRSKARLVLAQTRVDKAETNLDQHRIENGRRAITGDGQ